MATSRTGRSRVRSASAWRQFVGAKRHALADGERRGMVVDAEGKDHRVRWRFEMGADYNIRP
jgi:hypothetical protein